MERVSLSPAMAKPRNTPKRTTPKPAPSEAAPKRRAGRPANPNTQPLPPVTGLRLPLDLLDALDAYVEKRNAELASEGLTTNRTAVVIRLLREALAVKSAATGGA